MPETEQHLPAWRAAERRARARRTLVRAELVTGVISLEAALADPALAGIEAQRVIRLLPGYGVWHTERLLTGARISYSRLCGELTDRQRALLGQRARAR